MPTSGQLELERLRKRKEIVIKDLTICYNCKSTGLTEQDKFCPHCGFPQQGTQQQMQSFVIRMRNKKKMLEEIKSKVKKARDVLYILAVANLVLGIIMSVNSTNVAAGIIISVIIGGIFFGLGLWCKKNPFAAILTGFFFYITLIILNAVLDPASIVQGIIWKVLIISAFFYGYKAVREAQQLEKELADIKTSVDLTEENEMPGLSSGE